MMSNIVDDFSPAMWYNSIMKDCVGAIVEAIPRWLLVSSSRPTSVWQEMSNIMDDFSSTMWYNSIMKARAESHHGVPRWLLSWRGEAACHASPSDRVPTLVARTYVMDSTVRNIVWKNVASTTGMSAVRT